MHSKRSKNYLILIRLLFHWCCFVYPEHGLCPLVSILHFILFSVVLLTVFILISQGVLKKYSLCTQSVWLNWNRVFICLSLNGLYCIFVLASVVIHSTKITFGAQILVKHSWQFVYLLFVVVCTKSNDIRVLL